MGACEGCCERKPNCSGFRVTAPGGHTTRTIVLCKKCQRDGDAWTRKHGRRDPEFCCQKCGWYGILLERDKPLMECPRCGMELARYRHGMLSEEEVK